MILLETKGRDLSSIEEPGYPDEVPTNILWFVFALVPEYAIEVSASIQESPRRGLLGNPYAVLRAARLAPGGCERGG